jgi:peptidyl-prolyl cis-trans isomerase SurA
MNLRFFLATMMALSGFLFPAVTLSAVTSIDRIVALVNENVIMQSELDAATQLVKSRLSGQNTQMPPDDVLRKQVLEKLIIDHIQLELAERTGIKVDDNTLNKTISQIAADNNMTLEQMRYTLEKDGFSFDEYREQMRDQIIIQRLQRRDVVNNINISDTEVASFLALNYNPAARVSEYRIAHILIAVPEGASPARIQSVKQKAQSVLNDLRNGADFSKMAVSVSNGQQALEGGDLGWRKPAEVPTIFVEAVKSMGKGDISDLIRSPSGFHIIKVTDARGKSASHIIQQTRVRHILVNTNEVTSDDDARLRLTQIRTRLEGGDDFGALARSHSEDTASALKGGELGWVNPGAMVPKFEEVMNQTPIGAISEPFQTSFGWHILQVTDRRQQDNTSEFLKARAREQIFQRKVDEEIEAWLRRLRDEAYIEYHLADE